MNLGVAPLQGSLQGVAPGWAGPPVLETAGIQCHSGSGSRAMSRWKTKKNHPDNTVSSKAAHTQAKAVCSGRTSRRVETAPSHSPFHQHLCPWLCAGWIILPCHAFGPCFRFPCLHSPGCLSTPCPILCERSLSDPETPFVHGSSCALRVIWLMVSMMADVHDYLLPPGLFVG